MNVSVRRAHHTPRHYFIVSVRRAHHTPRHYFIVSERSVDRCALNNFIGSAYFADRFESKQLESASYCDRLAVNPSRRSRHI